MRRTIGIGTAVSVCIYTLLFITSLMLTKGIDLEKIKLWGFGFSVLLLLGTFPLHKTLTHGRSAVSPTYTTFTPPDEQYQDKLQQDYKATKEQVKFQGVFLSAGLITLIITILLAKL
ncbi:hypothetical protein DS745_15575 [Anaerobacillus alkaliphilus]|uniref:DUF3899 domain-containing protein n=1 Tax=Anaerobacillus alkaliphilus TaxID=1548597 RepID=A0A4Q0VN71_9BACI|nr:hypothetical protein [Anaerobacillus alkaliphilus]RXI97786.1 hypothetical protein DS745_15575 [Anaerobacillus alkaliphilus]